MLAPPMADETHRHRGTNDENPPSGADPYHEFAEFDLPAYVGPASFQKLPWLDDAAVAERQPDVAIIGAPFDDAVSHRPGARFGPRAIRTATYHAGSVNSLQLGIQPFEWLDVVDAGDAPIVPSNTDRSHEVIRRKVAAVAEAGAIPITRSPSRQRPPCQSMWRPDGWGWSTSTPTPMRPPPPGACSDRTERRCGA
jgi:hypothetical protein